MSKAMRQMPGKPGRVGVAQGEAVRTLISDEAGGPPSEHPGTGSAMPKAGTGGLLDAALTRQNLQAAGIMDGGVVMDRYLGTPQGGPLSPLLANVLLDEVDKVLEARGYSFVRYADDCNVYVGSRKAGERVMEKLRPCLLGWKSCFGMAQTPRV